ncbi:hypothetical protein H4Q26_011639 [Puccinia striiformis f. sp. tritici PST-130]|nr:hypothetical protein H4Q26_011639 [Puccinia striiformis f. sp. tritici PST-130]
MPAFQPVREEGVSIDETGPLSLMDLISDRPLEETIGGIYYIKPNYPGRSAHVLLQWWFCGRSAPQGTEDWENLSPFFSTLCSSARLPSFSFQPCLQEQSGFDCHLGFPRISTCRIDSQSRPIETAPAGDSDSQSNEGEEFVDAIVYWKELI